MKVWVVLRADPGRIDDITFEGVFADLGLVEKLVGEPKGLWKKSSVDEWQTTWGEDLWIILGNVPVEGAP